MIVNIIKEEGYRLALFGIGLSYGKTSKQSAVLFDTTDDLFELDKKAKELAFLDGGENKFLRQISVWLDITAPFYWWKQFDTYKVGTTAQSESTMHTLLKEPFHITQFETGKMLTAVVYETLSPLIDKLNQMRKEYLAESDPVARKTIWYGIVGLLPESFLQRRIVSLNYAVLQNIIAKRRMHKLDQWRYFCRTIFESCEHPEFLMEKK